MKQEKNLSISFHSSDAFLFSCCVRRYRPCDHWKVRRTLREERMGYCLGLVSPYWLHLYCWKLPVSAIYQVFIKWGFPEAVFISNIFWKIIVSFSSCFKMLGFFVSLNFSPPPLSYLLKQISCQGTVYFIFTFNKHVGLWLIQR